MSKKIQASVLFLLCLGWGTLSVRPAEAFSGGIASTALGPSGCNQCHNGGLVETVKLAGPAYVDPGSTVEYQVSLVVRGSQDHGGLNASASDGVLSTGGEFESETQVIAGAEGRDEITHTSAKLADVWDQVEFTFLWTAPESFSSVTLDVWANGVDNSGDPTGDQASFISLEILPLSEQPKEPVCAADLVPTSPLPVTDPEAQTCQKAVGKAGLAYTKGVLRSVQKCLQDFHRWGLTGDHDELCVGSSEAPPADLATAEKVAKAEKKALAFLDKKCTDETIAPLDLCADTLDGFKSCFLDSYQPLIAKLAGVEFGDLKQTDDKTLRKCQKMISKEAAKFVLMSLKTMQKCVSAMNDSVDPQDTAAICMGSVADGAYVQPTDAKATKLISKAEGKLRSKLAGACTSAQLASLDSCGDDMDSLAGCLMCTHRAVAYDAMKVSYGGANADSGTE